MLMQTSRLFYSPTDSSPSLLISTSSLETAAAAENRVEPAMSIAPATNPSLCSSSSPSLSRTQPTRKLPCFYHLPKLSFTKILSFTESSIRFSDSQSSKHSAFVLKASPSSATESQPSKSEAQGGGEGEGEYEEYEVELEKPYGLKFTKGPDGGTYIDAIALGGAADMSGMFTVGDKVIATSAVFGEEIWPAAEYGRTMYAIRQRIGPLLMKMQKRDGKLPDAGELTEKEIIRAERNSGVVSATVREIQLKNYKRKQEQKERRQNELREGLKLYRSGQYEEALEKFESVLGSKPELDEASIASYNVACCYSKLNQIQAGISALEDALKAGYEDFKTIRNDPDLANLRASEEFEPLIKKYDEFFINENAINAIKSLFGMFNKN